MRMPLHVLCGPRPACYQPCAGYMHVALCHPGMTRHPSAPAPTKLDGADVHGAVQPSHFDKLLCNHDESHINEVRPKPCITLCMAMCTCWASAQEKHAAPFRRMARTGAVLPARPLHIGLPHHAASMCVYKHGQQPPSPLLGTCRCPTSMRINWVASAWACRGGSCQTCVSWGPLGAHCFIRRAPCPV